MRKSNYIALAVFAAAAAIMLALWYYLGFNKVDNPLDFTIAIIWWVIIIAIALIIAKVEKDRRRAIRTIYVSPTALFNSERGMVGLKDVDGVDAMQNILEGLEYGFDKKELPSRKKFDYQFVVRTDEFKAGEDEVYGLRKLSSEELDVSGAAGDHELAFDDGSVKSSNDDPSAGKSGNSKEPKWTGVVTKIDRENGNLETKFSCMSELRAALA